MTSSPAPLETWRDFTAADVKASIAGPNETDDKYSRGVVLLATGSLTYPGAAVLTALGASRAGAGMLRYTGPTRVADAVMSERPEVVHGLGRSNALVIGSGIPDAREDERRDLLRSALASKYPSVVDAGALTLMSAGWQNVVITPHAGELSALFDRLGLAKRSREEIAAAPGESALLAADELGCTVLLKGAATHIANREHRIRVESPTHWLATAGTGDVLAGILGTLLAARHARGEAPEHARDAAAAVWLHARAAWLAALRNAGEQPAANEVLAPAAELWAGAAGGPILASDIAQALPTVIAAVLRS